MNDNVYTSFRQPNSPRITHLDACGPTHSSPNEVKFDEDVKALLAENYTHRDLKLRLHQLVMEEAKELPQIKVLYCASYGGFGVSTEFRAFLDSRSISIETSDRSDPALIQAISDYGRFICDRFPFILDDMKTVNTWKLDILLAKLKNEFWLPSEMEFDPDFKLVAEATSFINQMCNTEGHWRSDCLGIFKFPKGERLENNFMAFTELYPDLWMAHYSIRSNRFKFAFRFAHVLLQGGDHARYRVEPDEAQDAAIYERIGLYGACTTFSDLAIDEIPALVDYSIHEYDGLETVEYWCK